MDEIWPPELVGWGISAGAVILIIYYVLLIRCILQMLGAKSNQVLLVFAFLATFPVPPAIVMGIVIMIIWAIHRKAG